MLIVAVELEKVPKPSGFQRTFIISDRHRTSEVYQGIREVKYLTHRIKFAPYKLLVRYLQLGKIRGVLFSSATLLRTTLAGDQVERAFAKRLLYRQR